MLNLSPPRALAWIFPQATWRMPAEGNRVYLTFDDGPTPGITPWVLSQLSAFGARATFFCLGRNAERYPALLEAIRQGGHTVGNHGYSHLRGYQVPIEDYVKDTELADSFLTSGLFRPPYGRITRGELALLSARYRVVLWSLLSMDYSRRVSPARSLNIVTRNVRAGDIIVFHDSLRAERNLHYVLPRTLDFLHAHGFVPAPLPPARDLVAVPETVSERVELGHGL